MHYRTATSAERFLEIVRGGNAFDGVGGNQREALRVLMPDDVCLMDTTSTDYAGRICLVKTPQDGKRYYMRLFYEGDTVLMCDPTDGEEVDRCKVDELECSGIVTAIVRKLEAEEPVDIEAAAKVWDTIRATWKDPLTEYYTMSWDAYRAIKKKVKGSGIECLMSGFAYGFAQGRKAEKNAKRRAKRKANRRHPGDTTPKS